MFKPVPSKVNFPQLEEEILKFWKERRIFERSVEERRDRPLFVFYEGPPTANASPGVHHVLSRVFKDVIPRYKTMKGYCAPRKAGWDTHGLPVELEVERELGFSSKREIEEYGIDRFNAKCRESVFRYLEDWQALTERIGFWLDMEHPYITLDNDYIESCWWIVKELWERGLIYQGYKVTPHCPRCGTSLSSHEVSLGYRDDTEDPSVYIKFKLVSKLPPRARPEVYRKLYTPYAPTYFLAWTTTPWTLPGNTALAVAPEAEYAIMEGSGERLILASALVRRVGLEGYQLVNTVLGSDLVGLEYEPLFKPSDFGVPVERLSLDYYYRSERHEELPPETYPIIGAEFVSMSEGTGIVHIAPAFGEVDYEVGKAEGLYFVRDYVDLEGMIRGSYPFAGLFVKDADPLILDDLRSRKLLYRSERIVHTYPFCWRCDTPLLYYAKPSWYIKTTALKGRLLSGNDEINWYPQHIKYGRFGDWLQNNVDWAFSRERYWGTPLPIWRCQGCGHEECIGSVDDLRRLAHHEAMAEYEQIALDECLKDLHRPFIDKVILKCPESKEGSSHYPDRMKRLPEVIDCWFDSGAMPVAQWHYPFENNDQFQKSFPADYICEAVDQTRGWFYTLHALSILLFDRPCFKNVICLGHILDAKGEKMSKSKGNVVDPWLPIERYGADALRWYLLTSSPPGNVRRFSTELVGEAMRKFLLTLWNTYSFFVIYANIDRFDPRAMDTSYRSELDRWIISELNCLILEVTRYLDSYSPTEAGRRIEAFVDDLSNWYVRRSRRRFWKSGSDADKLAAYNTLYECLVTLSKLLAPFTPFVAEELYQNLVRSPYPEAAESVHLADFPEARPDLIDEQLDADTRLAMKVASLGRAARSKAGIKVRQPLGKVTVKVTSEREKNALRRIEAQILDELNVKTLEIVDSDWHLLLPESNLSVVSEWNYSVAVPRDIPPELFEEGLAREIVHRLQTMRRSAGFDIADYILTYYQGDTAIKRVVEGFAEYIKQETLSRELLEGPPPNDAYVETHRIGGEQLLLGVKRLA